MAERRKDPVWYAAQLQRQRESYRKHKAKVAERQREWREEQKLNPVKLEHRRERSRRNGRRYLERKRKRQKLAEASKTA
jgi:hypothetical protein